MQIEKKFAVLIDADNASVKNLKPIAYTTGKLHW